MTEEFYIDPRLQEEIEQQLLELPIVQYAWLPAKELTFSENVRKICREECPRYGTSWACPPAVGTVTECQERCNAYPVRLYLRRLRRWLIQPIWRKHWRHVGSMRRSQRRFERFCRQNLNRRWLCRRIPVKFAEPVPTRMHRAVIRIIWCHALKDTGSW